MWHVIFGGYLVGLAVVAGVYAIGLWIVFGRWDCTPEPDAWGVTWRVARDLLAWPIAIPCHVVSEWGFRKDQRNNSRRVTAGPGVRTQPAARPV